MAIAPVTIAGLALIRCDCASTAGLLKSLRPSCSGCGFWRAHDSVRQFSFQKSPVSPSRANNTWASSTVRRRHCGSRRSRYHS